jgi:hypothetical protein
MFGYITSQPSKKFSTLDECINYVRSGSYTQEKLFVGGISCKAIFKQISNQRDEQISSLANCILKDFDNINDDSTGLKVVSVCGDKTKSADIARQLAQNFSQSWRLSQELEKHREKIEDLQSSKNLYPYPQTLTPSQFPMPLIIEDGAGNLTPCINNGVMVHCP